MNIKEISARLVKSGIPADDALFEARLMCSHFLSIPIARAITTANFDHMPGVEELAAAVEKRASRYPLQYILGEWEFYGLPMYVSEDCLIPRADTEVIVEKCVDFLKNRLKTAEKEGIKLLDLCTGSGCIAAAVLSNVEECAAVMVDISSPALNIARRNIERLGLGGRVQLMQGDATVDLFSDETNFDLIVSNPPYIAVDEMAGLEPELSHEPRVSLTDESDGLSVLRGIIRAYKGRIKPGGAMILEHGYAQSEQVLEFAGECGMRGEVVRDYGGNCRGVVLVNTGKC